MQEQESGTGSSIKVMVMDGLVVCVLAAFGWVFLTQVDWKRGPTALPDDGTRVEVGTDSLTAITSIPEFLSYRDASIEEGQILLVVFGATWCGPCRRLTKRERIPPEKHPGIRRPMSEYAGGTHTRSESLISQRISSRNEASPSKPKLSISGRSQRFP